jgi:hypothetical protein
LSDARVNPTTSTWFMSTTTTAISPPSFPTSSDRHATAHGPIWWSRSRRPRVAGLGRIGTDAYVRHLQVVVPTDAVAHIDAELGAAALKMMERNMSAELTLAAGCLA